MTFRNQFRRNPQNETVYEAVARIIHTRTFGTEFSIMSTASVRKTFQKEEQDRVWSLATLTGTISTLVRIGIIKRLPFDNYGGIGYRSVRAFDPEKDEAAVTNQHAAYWANRKHNDRPRTRRKEISSTEELGTKLMFAVGEKDTVVLTVSQARMLWTELNRIFN